MTDLRIISLLILVVSVLTLGRAQMPFVPPEFYDGRRSVEGDKLRVCLWEHSSVVEFDRSVAEAVGEALLLQIEFHEIRPTVELVLDGEIWEHVFFALADECHVFLGVELAPEAPLPDWVLPVRPYLSAPYVLVVTDRSYETLGDLPADSYVGSFVGTKSDLYFLAALRDNPNLSIRRLPFDDLTMALSYLADGTLQGLIVWGPSLLQVGGADLITASLSPMPAIYREIGGLVLASDAYIVSQLDYAINALIADGTLADLITQFGLPGSVPRD